MRIPKINSSYNTENEQEQTLEIKDYGVARKTKYEIVEDEKAKTKFIKMVEKIVRSSYEYKEYINFLKTEVDMNCCSFFNSIDRTSMNGVRLEIHHSPFTLFDITSIVTNKFIQEHRKINPISIAEEVMELHFKGYIGLIPLSLTIHDLVHSGELFIPVDKVYGNIVAFVSEYEQYMTNEQRELLLVNIDTTECLEEYKPNVIEKKYTYLDIEDVSKPEKIILTNEMIG
mgnify:CR=1 FL=1